MTKIYVGIDDQVIEATGDLLKQIEQNETDFMNKQMAILAQDVLQAASLV
jgi:hypothetical protein